MTNISSIRGNLNATGTNGLNKNSTTVKQSEENIHQLAKQDKKDLPSTANPIDIDSLSDEQLQLFQDINSLMEQYQDPAELLEAAEAQGYSQADIEDVFGAPPAQEESLVEGDTQDADMPPADVDPDTYAQTYADENGLTLEEAKAELSEKYGDPTQPEEAGAADGTKATSSTDKADNANGSSNEDQQLIEAGIPQEVVNEGQDAIMIFLMEQLNVPEDIISQGEEAIMEYLKENLG